MRIQMGLAAILLIVAAPAFAEERDYCPARPGLGTPACTISPGRVSVEMGLADWSVDQDSSQRTDTVLIGDTLVRIGLTDTIEAQTLSFPLEVVSMAPALEGQRQRTHDYLYWEFHERGFQQAVRNGRWKAVRQAKAAPLELYDLAADPYEQHDVAAGHRDVVARIERYMQSARTESARWPVQ